MNVGETVLIRVSVADVHAEPDAASERVTQSLLGRPGLVLERQPGWLRLAFDDYEGWVAEALLIASRPSPRLASGTPLPPGGRGAGGEGLPTSSALLVTEPQASIRLGDGRTLAVFAGTELVGRAGDSGSFVVELPDGRVGRLSVAHAARWPFPPLAASATPTIALRFLSVPYLWGGTTAGGLDCSGFVQLLYRLAGYRLPRDAEPQRLALKEIVPRQAVCAGDLLFFGPNDRATHVALAVDAITYIHAAKRPGRVLVSSLDENDPDYDAEHVPQFLGARRVVAGGTDAVAQSGGQAW